MGLNTKRNVQAGVVHETRTKKRHAAQTINTGLGTRCMRFNELYPVGSIVELSLSQHVSLVIAVESKAIIVHRNGFSFIEFNHGSKDGAYLINLVKRKID